MSVDVVLVGVSVGRQRGAFVVGPVGVTKVDLLVPLYFVSVLGRVLGHLAARCEHDTLAIVTTMVTTRQVSGPVLRLGELGSRLPPASQCAAPVPWTSVCHAEGTARRVRGTATLVQ